MRLSIPLLAVLLAVQGASPAWAQPRELGPPVGGGGLEGSEQEEPSEEAPPDLIPVPAPNARPATAPALPDRTRQLLGEIEVLDLPLAQIPNYREEMRDVIEELSIYARARNPEFILVTRPGFDLLTWHRREFDLAEIKRDPSVKTPPDAIAPIGMPIRRYIQSIDGIVLNGQFCAPLRVPRGDLALMMDFGLKAMSIDHCKNEETLRLALANAAEARIVTHADTDNGDVFASIPNWRPVPENPGNVAALNAAKNMLVVTNNRRFGSRDDYLYALQRTNYDVLTIDPFYNGNQPLAKDEVHKLKYKEIGARRLVLARLDIGHAEDTRAYWQRDWRVGNPSWIIALAPEAGQHVVEFWNPAWKSIIGRYFAGIMDLGFDGVMVDGVEAYRRFEFMTPIDPVTGM